MRLRNNERLPAPDLPSAALESWAYSVVFSFSLPLPASCDICLKTETISVNKWYIRTDPIIADTDAFVKTVNRNTANSVAGRCPKGNSVYAVLEKQRYPYSAKKRDLAKQTQLASQGLFQWNGSPQDFVSCHLSTFFTLSLGVK